MTQIELVHSIIPAFPNIKILCLFNKSSLDFLNELNNFVQDLGGEIDLCSFDDDFSSGLSNVNFCEKLAPNSLFTVRGYEFLIIRDLDIKDFAPLLKESYHALENSGNIFIFIKPDLNQKENIEALMAKQNFVAINSIEETDFYLISAKKMHGWGGGM